MSDDLLIRLNDLADARHSDPIFSQINRAVHEAKERREVGMQVGLGKVWLDISQVEHLLKHYASLQAENDEIADELRNNVYRVSDLESENAALRERLDTLPKDLLESCRGVVDPCSECGGWGVKPYGGTSTWTGRAGGQVITSGVCNQCWGSGDSSKPWPSLRNS